MAGYTKDSGTKKPENVMVSEFNSGLMVLNMKVFGRKIRLMEKVE